MFTRTRDLFNRLTGTFEERRKHARYDAEIGTTCSVVGETDTLKARIRNVSSAGINLLVSVEIRPNAMVRIQLPQTLNGKMITVLASVLHAQEEAGKWSLGCRFSEELSDDEMRIFGCEKRASNAGDARTWVRHKIRRIISYRILPGDEAEPESAELVNVSPSGAGVLLTQPIEVGSAVAINFNSNSGSLPRAMVACVVYVSEQPDGKWAAGFQFIRELKESELSELVRSMP